MEQDMDIVLSPDTETNNLAVSDHPNGDTIHRDRLSPLSDLGNPWSPAPTNTNYSDIGRNNKDDFFENCDPASTGTLGVPGDAPFTEHCSDTMPHQTSEEKLRVDSVVGQDDIHCESSNFSGPTSPELLDDSAFEELEVSQGQLRPQCRQMKFATTWLDTDTTGDYDPVEDQRMNRSRRSRANARSHTNARSGDDTISSHSASSRVESSCGTEEAAKLPVTLKFSSENGQRLFARKVNDYETQLHSDEPGYRLRKRNIKPLRRGHCEKLSDLDLTAKPLSRGCYACNHSKRCNQCEAFDHPCIAGPVQAYIKPRKRYERDWDDDPYPQAKRKKNGQPKTPLACLECRQEGARCEYLHDDDGHFRSACSKCLVETLPCTIYDRDQLAQADPRAVVKVQGKSDSLPPQSPPDQASGEEVSASGTLCTIRTSFSHPFIFNCDDDSQRPHSSTTPNDDGGSCHFCTEPSLPFFGLGQIETQVIDFPDSPGFVEMGDGYRSRGIENTRLCAVCTLRRMCVVMCDKHTMRPIADLADLAAFSPSSQEAAEEELLEGKLTSDDAERFCTVCTRLAIYECVSETGEEIPGCGLRMCQACAVTLEGTHHGKLKDMLVVWDTATEQSLMRADCELLREDGALTKYLRHTITQ
ncbi:hypothetical protein HII31_06099 [Pseudocercospora fuligena]|uniref:Zn(2)-C6 fungal-type domain-containing protein n=1 Tax=Pseudocercospora fuligena TaxID=685502 RepID=A0A8H6VJC0_9PEZI|nr:hypothetical protein HII31_06099 [Pseudocercospora fuligena]